MPEHPLIRELVRELVRVPSASAGTAGFHFSLSVVGGTSPTTTPTYTGPSVFWAPDNDGVYQNMGALTNALGQAIPPVAGCRMVGNVATPTTALGVALSGMQMVLQPAVTNKVTARKRNPTDTTNIAKGGDAAAVLSRVLDTTALSTAGLGVICNSGYVYELNNSAGVGLAYMTFFGTTGNTNPHSGMLHVRKVAGAGTPYISFSVTAITANITSANYTRLTISPSAAANDGLAVLVPAGCVIRCILPSLTETMAPTAYPIVDVTDGLNAVTFVATDYSYPNLLPVNNWQWRAKIKIDGTPATDMWLWSDGTAGVYYKAADSKIYYKHGGGTEIATAAVTVGNTYDIGVSQSSTAGASISLNQVVTTNAAVTANYTPGAILSIGEKGNNTLYFRGRLQQQANLDAFAFTDQSFATWYRDDI